MARMTSDELQQRAWRVDKVRDWRRWERPSEDMRFFQRPEMSRHQAIAEGWRDHLEDLEDLGTCEPGPWHDPSTWSHHPTAVHWQVGWCEDIPLYRGRTFTSASITRTELFPELIPEANKEAKTMTADNPTIVRIPTGAQAKARHPWRTNVRITESLTLAPDPEASATDAELLAYQPATPGTARKVVPDDLDAYLDERRLVRAGA